MSRNTMHATVALGPRSAILRSLGPSISAIAGLVLLIATSAHSADNGWRDFGEVSDGYEVHLDDAGKPVVPSEPLGETTAPKAARARDHAAEVLPAPGGGEMIRLANPFPTGGTVALPVDSQPRSLEPAHEVDGR